MAFDGIVTKHVVYELNTCLIDGKINKIFQPNKNEIILGIYSNGKNYALLINIDSQNYRMHLTTTKKANPQNAFNFCMLLRKHLIGMKIKSITNVDLDRIIEITLEGYDELNDFITKKLIVELMGKHGNIILVNENNIIIDALRHLDTYNNSSRNILPAHPYSLPETSKHSFIALQSFDEFKKIISISTNYIDSICNSFTGLSKQFLQYVIEKLKLNEANPKEKDLKLIYEYIKNVITSSSLECVHYTKTKKDDYVIDISDTNINLSTNFFLDDFYKSKEDNDNFKSYRNNILKLILETLKKYTKRLNNIDMKLEECSSMDSYKLYGELITSNLYRINSNVNLDKIELENYYEDNRLITIPLDKTISISNNARKYFKKYNKLKKALEIVTIQKKETASEINYIESIIYEIESAKNISELNVIYDEIAENVIFKDNLGNTNKVKKNKVSKKKNSNTEDFSPIVLKLDCYTIYVGKNNKQNDYLSLKFANKNDLWFHTKDVHGSHVILKTNGNDIEQELINKCASIAAFYSKASSSSNVAVDYCFARYLKKPNDSKPGMVIYTNYETVNVQPNNNY